MSLAVYTTIYPGVEPYLADWYQSLCRQTDRDFDLWIGLDMLEPRSVQALLGHDIPAHWVVAASSSSPAEIRQQALIELVDTCSGVVCVDSDDVLHPDRVCAARAGLEANDLVGCALTLVDAEGKSLDLTFSLPAALSPDGVLPRNNVYGLSNSAFRTDLLKKCLPIPSAAVLVDWFLSTRAWLLGARLAFDRVPGMDYRQHDANTARLRYPLSADQVTSDTALVRQHLQLVLSQPGFGALPGRLVSLRALSTEIEIFQSVVVQDARRLQSYVDALNDLRPAPLWWASVANPALQTMWTSENREI
jgi:hypothetical protein